MTIETIPGSDAHYYLINFDKDGRERLDDPAALNGRLSDTLVEALVAQPITDCFFMSHGWKGDVPAAKQQYDTPGPAPCSVAPPISSACVPSGPASGLC